MKPETSEEKPLPLPTSRNKDGRSGKMSKEVVTKDLQILGFEKMANPETTWRDDTPKETKTSSILTLILAMVALLTIIAVVLKQTVLDKSPRKSDEVATISGPANSLKVPKYSINHFIESADANEIESSIKATLNSFARAQTTEERLAHVAPRSGLREKMTHFYQEHPDRLFSSIHDLGQVKPAALDGNLYYAIDIQPTKDADRIFFGFIPGPDRMLIEWESSVAYGDLPLDDFPSKKPSGPQLMRIFISNLTGTSEITNDGLLKISVIAKASRNYCYTNPANPDFQKLNKILQTDPTSRHPVTVKMSWNAEKQLPEITGLVHRFWVEFEAE